MLQQKFRWGGGKSLKFQFFISKKSNFELYTNFVTKVRIKFFSKKSVIYARHPPVFKPVSVLYYVFVISAMCI